MPTYKVKNGQNIFDISLLLYGSVEGVYDLMISNGQLSMADDLKAGDELEYHDGFVINESVPEYFTENNITPTNSARHVYYKKTDAKLRCVIDWLVTEYYAAFSLSGDGEIIVDWGDNSELETIQLNSVSQRYEHYFDNTVSRRLVRFYGDFNIKEFNATEVFGNIMPMMPITVDEFVSYKNNLTLTGLFLFNGLYSVNLQNSKVTDLMPIGDASLQYLNLTGCKIKTEVIDKYLIYIATHYGTRRNCQVYLSTKPSGVYTMPSKDTNGNYIIDTGMKAVWVIMNEASWNESGSWNFYFNGVSLKNALPYSLPFALS